MRITTNDARLMLRYVAGLYEIEKRIFRYDVTGDNKITTADAKMVLRMAAGLEPSIMVS